MKSVEWIVGFIVGILVTGLLVILIVRMLKKQSGVTGGEKKYDERQMAVRGVAYRAAYWTMIVYSALNAMLQEFSGVIWAEPFMEVMIGALISITVFVEICLCRDAYFPVNVKSDYYLKLFTFIFLLEAAVTVLNAVLGDSFVEDGKLSYHAMPVVILVMYGIVVPTILVQRKKAAAEDEE